MMSHSIGVPKTGASDAFSSDPHYGRGALAGGAAIRVRGGEGRRRPGDCDPENRRTSRLSRVGHRMPRGWRAFAGRTIVDGDLGRPGSAAAMAPPTSGVVHVRGAAISAARHAQIVIRTPRASTSTRVERSGARGPLRPASGSQQPGAATGPSAMSKADDHQASRSGNTRTGSAGEARIRVAGSGDTCPTSRRDASGSACCTLVTSQVQVAGQRSPSGVGRVSPSPPRDLASPAEPVRVLPSRLADDHLAFDIADGPVAAPGVPSLTLAERPTVPRPSTRVDVDVAACGSRSAACRASRYRRRRAHAHHRLVVEPWQPRIRRPGRRRRLVGRRKRAPCGNRGWPNDLILMSVRFSGIQSPGDGSFTSTDAAFAALRRARPRP